MASTDGGMSKIASSAPCFTSRMRHIAGACIDRYWAREWRVRLLIIIRAQFWRGGDARLRAAGYPTTASRWRFGLTIGGAQLLPLVGGHPLAGMWIDHHEAPARERLHGVGAADTLAVDLNDGTIGAARMPALAKPEHDLVLQGSELL